MSCGPNRWLESNNLSGPGGRALHDRTVLITMQRLIYNALIILKLNCYHGYEKFNTKIFY